MEISNHTKIFGLYYLIGEKAIRLDIARVCGHIFTSHRQVKIQHKSAIFQFQIGTFLTRQKFVQHIHSALQKTGVVHYILLVDPTKYNGHSFRIGAATTAAKGMEDSMIKTLGR